MVLGIQSTVLEVVRLEPSGCERGSTQKKRRNRNVKSVTAEYQAWVSMKRRCYSPKYNSFHRYGGRGISVCERWRHGQNGFTGFECFLKDVGKRPSSKHSLDRIDGDGNYEPGNCRWATGREQYGKTCRIKWVELDGERMMFVDACAKYGISTHNADNRIRYGWKLEDAIKLPLQPRGFRYAR